MKLPALCLIVLMPPWFAVASAQAPAVDPNDIERLLDAIARVESHYDPDAVGDGGRALGVYQIHRAYWEDGTRLLGVDWPHRDASDPTKARQVVKAYLLHYGKGRSLIEMARIHNGGPCGYRKKATLLRAKDPGGRKSAVARPRSAVVKPLRPLRPVLLFAFALSRLSPRGLGKENILEEKMIKHLRIRRKAVS